MAKALILNGEVVDIHETEFEVSPEMSWVDCDDTVEVSYLYDADAGTFSNPYVPPTAEEHLANLRFIRDDKLKASDWTQGADSPLTDAKKTEWATYRQALRDITNTYTSVVDVVWPTKPE